MPKRVLTAEAIEELRASDFSQDAPIRLDVAAKLTFPDGSMGAVGLRKERDKGRLVTEIIAGKEYVTLAEIERMRERCRVQRKASDLPGARKTSTQVEADIARAATRALLLRLKNS